MDFLSKEENQNGRENIKDTLTNIGKIDNVYVNDVKNLSQRMETTSKITDLIRSQTFKLLTLPAFHSFNWEQPNQIVKFPVTAVVVDKSQTYQCYALNTQLIKWIQSGGSRCIAMKTESCKEQIQKFLSLTHCAVIGEPQGNIQEFGKFIHILIEIVSKQKHYPLLFLGRSALIALEMILGKEIETNNKKSNALAEFIPTHTSILFGSLDICLRVELENRKKIRLPHIKILSKQIQQTQAFMNWSDEEICSVIQFPDKQIYFILNDPLEFNNLESNRLWNCAILNFIERARKFEHEVPQEKVQKMLVGRNKIVYKVEAKYYDIV